MDEAHLTKVANLAAQETVRQTFRLFGVDVYDQDQVNSLRSDLAFAHHMRKSGDKAKSTIIGVVVAAALFGFYQLVVEGIHSLWQTGRFH